MSEFHDPYFKPGDVVVFREHVFSPPLSPNYDRYKDHLFVIEKYYDEDDDMDEPDSHLWLKCVSEPIIKVEGYVHSEDLIKVN